MKTMIVGGGGREHALAMASYEAGSELVFTQPNAGMGQLGISLGIDDRSNITRAAADLAVDLAIIGPEAPLAAGLADQLRAEDIPVLGFGAEAARLESSKVFANDFMDEYGILKPAGIAVSNLEDGLLFVKGRKADDYVIKADGLAGGYGVVLPDSKKQARQVLIDMMSGEMFGEAGRQVLFQERLHGEEVSMIALFDGEKATVLSLTQDYKRLGNQDKGPNTGGMGSYAPVPPEIASEWQVNQMYGILEKTLYGFEDRGMADPGVIYIGFMLAEEFGGDPAVMEYNVRFGDPETQTEFTLLQDGGVNMHEIMYAAALGGLDGERISTIKQSGRTALTVCLAAEGYPEAPSIGQPVYNLCAEYPNVTVHHGATRYIAKEGDRTFTNGGRVVYVTGVGDTIKGARKAAYNAIEDDGLYFDGMQFRQDIGKRAMKAVKKAKK